MIQLHQHFGIFVAFVAAATYPTRSHALQEENQVYGVDCSFPVHYKQIRCGGQLGDRQKFYNDFMNGCRERYPGPSCDETEDGRLEMSLRQPKSMVNYTSTGYTKIKAPPEIWKLLSNYFNDNYEHIQEEEWSKGNIYTNHWVAPTYMIDVEDSSLPGGGIDLKNIIWDAAKVIIEEWTQMELTPSSMYGVRVYTEGAVLSPHADRMPLISSAIINVAQDVDEDWPLEVYDRQGNAVNITMEPGDMVLYESGTLVHGRPFPLKGRYYANVFIHFEPTGRPLNHDNSNIRDDKPHEFLPPYILPGSEEAKDYLEWNPSGWKSGA